ncbi:hypothetical protein ACLQ29_22125 [Micromonospora sp. DT228]|uniref:hypothetical protein n=1 Tax=Micromonospora sp. DT228 TaxID=3393443 RepID=UPI003CF30E9D
MALFAAAVGAGFLLAALFQGPAAADGMRSGSGVEPQLEIGGLVEPVTRLTEAARPDRDRQRPTGADHRHAGNPDAPLTRAVGGVVAPGAATPAPRSPRSAGASPVSVPLPRVDTSGAAARETLRPASATRAAHRPARRVQASRPPADPARQPAGAAPGRPAMPRPAGTPVADLITAPLPHVASAPLPHVADIVSAPLPHVVDTASAPLPHIIDTVNASLPHVVDIASVPLPHVVDIVSALPIRPVVGALRQVTGAVPTPAIHAVVVPAAPAPPTPPALVPAAVPLADPTPAPTVPTPSAAPAEPALAPVHTAAAATAAPPWLSVVGPTCARASTGHPAARPDPVTAQAGLPGRPVTPADQDAAGADDGSPPGPGLVQADDRQVHLRAWQFRDLVPLLVASRAPAPIARPG